MTTYLQLKFANIEIRIYRKISCLYAFQYILIGGSVDLLNGFAVDRERGDFGEMVIRVVETHRRDFWGLKCHLCEYFSKESLKHQIKLR